MPLHGAPEDGQGSEHQAILDGPEQVDMGQVLPFGLITGDTCHSADISMSRVGSLQDIVLRPYLTDAFALRPALSAIVSTDRPAYPADAQYIDSCLGSQTVSVPPTEGQDQFAGSSSRPIVFAYPLNKHIETEPVSFCASQALLVTRFRRGDLCHAGNIPTLIRGAPEDGQGSEHQAHLDSPAGADVGRVLALVPPASDTYRLGHLLVSIHGTPEDGQGSEPQANLDVPELVDGSRVLQPVPLGGVSCHVGNIPMLLRGAPEVREGSKHPASLEGPERVDAGRVLPSVLLVANTCHSGNILMPLYGAPENGQGSEADSAACVAATLKEMPACTASASTYRPALVATVLTVKPACTAAAPYLDSSLGLRTVSVPPTKGQDPSARSSSKPVLIAYTATNNACQRLLNWRDNLPLEAPEVTQPSGCGSDYIISMYPHEACVGTLLVNLCLSEPYKAFKGLKRPLRALALSYPAMDMSSILSGTRTGPVQLGGFKETPDSGISKVSDTSHSGTINTPPRGAPKDGQSLAHGTNLEGPEPVEVRRVIPLVLLAEKEPVSAWASQALLVTRRRRRRFSPNKRIKTKPLIVWANQALPVTHSLRGGICPSGKVPASTYRAALIATAPTDRPACTAAAPYLDSSLGRTVSVPPTEGQDPSAGFSPRTNVIAYTATLSISGAQQINDSSTLPVTPFTHIAVLVRLSATRVVLTPISIGGAPEDEQGSEHQANLKIPKHVNVNLVLPLMLLVGTTSPPGNIPTSPRGAPKGGPGLAHQTYPALSWGAWEVQSRCDFLWTKFYRPFSGRQESAANPEGPERVEAGLVTPPVLLAGYTCHSGHILMSLHGTPEDGQCFEHQANLKVPECVNFSHVLPLVPLAGETPVSPSGALEDSHSSRHQANLNDPEWVNEGWILPPLPFAGDTCHPGKIPMPRRGAPEDGQGFNPPANLDSPECSQLIARLARIATAQYLDSSSGSRTVSVPPTQEHNPLVGASSTESTSELPIRKINGPLMQQHPQQQLQLQQQQLAEAFGFLAELQSSSVIPFSIAYTAATSACEGLVQFYDNLPLWTPEDTPPLGSGSDHIISMWPPGAYLGTLLTRSLISALSCPAIDLSSTLSGFRISLIQPWGVDGTQDRGIDEQALFWVPQISDSSTPHTTSFTSKARIEWLSATKVDLIPMSLWSALENGQATLHQANLEISERFHVGQVLSPVLLICDTYHSGIIPIHLLGTPEVGPVSEHRANLDVPELVNVGQVLPSGLISGDTRHTGYIPPSLRGAPKDVLGSEHHVNLEALERVDLGRVPVRTRMLKWLREGLNIEQSASAARTWAALTLGFFFLLKISKYLDDGSPLTKLGLCCRHVVLKVSGETCAKHNFTHADEVAIGTQGSKTDIFISGEYRNHFENIPVDDSTHVCVDEAVKFYVKHFPNKMFNLGEDHGPFLTDSHETHLTRNTLQAVLHKAAGQQPLQDCVASLHNKFHLVFLLYSSACGLLQGPQDKLHHPKTDIFNRGEYRNHSENIPSDDSTRLGAVEAVKFYDMHFPDKMFNQGVAHGPFLTDSHDTHLNRNTLQAVLHKAAEGTGYPAGSFGSHSLRFGGASALWAAFHDTGLVRRWGRWASDSFHTYIWEDRKGSSGIATATAESDITPA